MLKSRKDAYDLLTALKAPDHLVRHAHLVAESAVQLIALFQSLDIGVNFRLIELGAILHDSGKIQHPSELSEPGSLHEQAGQALLLAHGVQPEIARCCVSHGAWSISGVSLEERTVALADKLWKGKREADLELNIIDEIATRLGKSRWDIFDRLDTAFEEIAAGGSDRIAKSKLG